ncbi:hypothetical protein PENTCL1PPCAC_10254, partial [Pristionchus entomophagus]
RRLSSLRVVLCCCLGINFVELNDGGSEEEPMSSGGRCKRRVNGNKPSSDRRSQECNGANSDNAEQPIESSREKEKEKRVRKAKATRWTSKGNKKSFIVGGVVGRRICKDITVSHYYFYLECLEEFTLHGDASEKIYAGETHSFKVDEAQYKIFDADKPKKFIWLFLEEMENCETLIKKFEHQFREDCIQSRTTKVEAVNKIRREKAALDEEARKIRARLEKTGLNNLEPPRSNIYNWSPSCSSDDDYSQKDIEAFEKRQADNTEGGCIRFGDTNEEEKYVREPRDDQIKRHAFALFKNIKTCESALTDEELLRQYNECDEEMKARFLDLARDAFNARAELIIRRRLKEDDRRLRKKKPNVENHIMNRDDGNIMMEDHPMGAIDQEETIADESVVEKKRKKQGRKAKPGRKISIEGNNPATSPIAGPSESQRAAGCGQEREENPIAGPSRPQRAADSDLEMEDRIRDEQFAQYQRDLEDSYLKAPSEEDLMWIALNQYLEDVRNEERQKGKAVVEREYDLVRNDFEDNMNRDSPFKETYLAKGQAAWDRRALETLQKRGRERMQLESNGASMDVEDQAIRMNALDERVNALPDAIQIQQEDDDDIIVLDEVQYSSSPVEDSIFN